MARNYYIMGESMVSVKGNSNSSLGELAQLGLTDGPIRVSLRYYHQDIHVDDFGNRAPPEVLTMLGEASISMTLTHFDATVLQACVGEGQVGSDGTFGECGTPMGCMQPLFTANNHFISVNIQSNTASGQPWRFRACYLADTPFEWQMGTSRSLVSVHWRCIPYYSQQSEESGAAQEMVSTEVVLYDHTLDV